MGDARIEPGDRVHLDVILGKSQIAIERYVDSFVESRANAIKALVQERLDAINVAEIVDSVIDREVRHALTYKIRSRVSDAVTDGLSSVIERASEDIAAKVRPATATDPRVAAVRARLNDYRDQHGSVMFYGVPAEAFDRDDLIAIACKAFATLESERLKRSREDEARIMGDDEGADDA